MSDNTTQQTDVPRIQDNTGFEVYDNQGFKITSANGITVSVQFGRANYCDNNHVTIADTDAFRGYRCDNVELAIWTRDRKWITNEFAGKDYAEGAYDVEGYCKPERIAAAIVWAQTYKPDKV